MIMTPMDVMKQRLQLGHHTNELSSVFSAIMREQGPRAFFVSLPLTLGMNMPHAGVMGTINEGLRQHLGGEEGPGVVEYMASGTAAGAIAAFATNPLDVIKTRLQTQHLGVSIAGNAGVASSSAAPAPLVYSGVL